jgi:hypothetical protein
MGEIRLTNGDVALVDDDCVTLLEGYKWNCAVKKLKHGESKYASAYVKNGDEWDHLLMHRIIVGATKGVIVDHVDGNGINNHRYNLRIATHTQNMRNRQVTPGFTSVYKGVWWNKRDRVWQACIKCDGRTIHLGSFRTQEQAAVSYNEAARKYHGDFSLLNNLDGQG